MGSGKTVLIKHICLKMDIINTVLSPTYSIVNEYMTKSNSVIYHFDLYRFNNASDLLDIGYEEYFNSDCYCFVEWPELIDSSIHYPHVKIRIETIDNLSRHLEISLWNDS